MKELDEVGDEEIDSVLEGKKLDTIVFYFLRAKKFIFPLRNLLPNEFKFVYLGSNIGSAYSRNSFQFENVSDKRPST